MDYSIPAEGENSHNNTAHTQRWDTQQRVEREASGADWARRSRLQISVMERNGVAKRKDSEVVLHHKERTKDHNTPEGKKNSRKKTA